MQRGCLLIVLKGFCTTLAILSFDPSGLMAQARQRIARAPAPGIIERVDMAYTGKVDGKGRSWAEEMLVFVTTSWCV